MYNLKVPLLTSPIPIGYANICLNIKGCFCTSNTLNVSELCEFG